jgi:RNA polymerase sigma-70 factor, ECF subfamily
MHAAHSDTDSRATDATRATSLPFRKGLIDNIPRLRRYARALVSGNADAADDLVQETLTRALEKAHLWEPGTDLRAWLFALLHNQFINVVRQSARRGRQVGLDTPNALDAVPLSRPASQGDALALRDLRRALDQLLPEQREAMLLVALEAMPYEDVAKLVGVPVGTVRSRISRGRAMLRKLMDAPERASHTAKLREAASVRRVLRAQNVAAAGARRS